MEKSSDKNGIVIFGRDISKIPCFRNSYLFGICGGVACGLIRFMFTSRPRSSTNYAVGCFALITMAYWTQCRYEYSKTKFEMDRMKYLLQQQMLYEGTDREKKVKGETDEGLVDV